MADRKPKPSGLAAPVAPSRYDENDPTFAGATTAEAKELERQRNAPKLKVRATQNGYYGDVFRRPGDVFLIDATPVAEVCKRLKVAVPARLKDNANEPAAFSEKWMERVGPRTPERTSGPNDAIRQTHDEVLAGRAAGEPTGTAAPLGD